MATNDLAGGAGEGVFTAPAMATFGRLKLPAAEANLLSDRALIERIVGSGQSRLTAVRILETTRCGQLGPNTFGRWGTIAGGKPSLPLRLCRRPSRSG